MRTSVLSVASRAVLDACERRGLDGDALLAAAGLTRALVEDPDARIDAACADALWEHAFARAGDPFLALHAAESLPFGAYKVIDYLATHSTTVGDGMTQVAAYFAIVDPRALVRAEPGDPARVRVLRRDGGPLPAPAQEYTFAALVTRMRAVARFALERVDFTCPAPPDTREHTRVFECALRFEQAEAQLVFAREDWDAPVRTRDPALRALLEQHARALLGSSVSEAPTASRVGAEVEKLLRARQEPTLTRVARALGASERTLQRRLREEGVSFAARIDEVRASLARTYLDEPDLSLAEVAFLLGFADQSTFTRAFRRWTGMAPGAYRARA